MLNAADAIASHAEIWANAGPTATSVKFKDHSYVQGGTFIMYAWKAVAGVSAFGGYTGTAASHDISTGFAARYVMVKRTDSSHGWGVFDSFRGQGKAIFINTPDAENAGLGNALTLSSTGFTINGSDGATNANNGTYIYMAFA
jgi:hypothetical protein